MTISGLYYGYDSIAPLAELLSRQLHFSDVQIGALNAVYSLPNIAVALIGGLLIDRFGASRVTVTMMGISLIGAFLTAFGEYYPVMLLGRLLFGAGAETTMIAVIVALAQWFSGRSFALFFALNLSLGRSGSYLADRSPTFAHALYERGWQAPLWLATAAVATAFLGALIYRVQDRRQAERGAIAIPARAERIEWRRSLRFGIGYWSLLIVCVTFYSVIFPFRSTFAIKFFEQARGLSLADASRMNSYVFLTAIFAMPAFGFLVDRIGRHAFLLTIGALLLPLSFLLLADSHVSLGIPTALLGLSFSLVPAVLWPAVVTVVRLEHQGSAYGLMTMSQNAGLMIANIIAGYLNDRFGAGIAHPEGYAAMLWFFGSVSMIGFIFAGLLLGRRTAQPARS